MARAQSEEDDAPGADLSRPATSSAPRWRVPIVWQAILLVFLPTSLAGALGLWALTRDQAIAPLLTSLLIIQTAFVCASAALLSWHWSRRIARRIATIDGRLQELHDGHYDGHLPDRAGDEIGGLARRINTLSAEVALRERRIGENALMDPLTGLPNRTLLTDRIRHAIRSSERVREPFCVMLLDLDRFKFINDTLGHAAGDLILKEVSRRLRITVRDSDTVARLGGDEFVLLLPG